VSIPVVQVVVSSALTIVALALLVEMILSMEMLLCTLKSFKNQPQVFILRKGFGLGFEVMLLG